ncbi:MAG: nuclear transport factor 2 family protein [Pyrinomonadaceae bacterium]|nr:nuclear transport factor 2 family protein [Pyrinomonadaceae bacterium]MBP6214433.1 nuclear transport factor 2 family protein [Pyrinomonadaceae bacterium]
MNRIISIVVLIAATSLMAYGQTDEQSAIAVVDQLFAGMKAKNAEQIRSVFAPNVHFLAIQKPPDGKGISKSSVDTGESFVKLITESNAGEYIEKMISPEVVIDGDLAVVSGRYTFYVGDKFSHCGKDVFNLLRTEAGWKIVQGAFTLEFQCDRDLKAIDVPKIDADPKDVSTMDGIIKAFYATISGPKGTPRQWSRDKTLYMPDVRFVSMSEQNGKIRAGVTNHQQYVNGTNENFVSNGFTEREISRITRRFGNIAHVFSTYEYSNDAGTDKGRGVNSIELYWDGIRWWISSASWDDERPNNPIPKEFLPRSRK